MNDKQFKQKISNDLVEAISELLMLFIIWCIILIPTMINQL